jgi:ABC-type spermidine/putrescine transport system permease subunit I
MNEYSLASVENTIKKPHFTHWSSVLLLLLPTLFLIIFFIYPMVNVFYMSFVQNNHFSLALYQQFFSTSVYLKVIRTTLLISLQATMICLILGYPFAYFMTHCSGRQRALLFMCVMIPFWTGILIRCYSWIVMLQSNGVINSLLKRLGVIHDPVPLLHNQIGVLIGMVHILLPYMILLLSSVMEGINKNLILAANNLGAGPIRAFLRIYLPLSLPGIASGSLLVFIMGIGYYITPALLGGENQIMIAQVISVQMGQVLNWQFAAAIAFVLLMITMMALLIFRRLFNINKLW